MVVPFVYTEEEYKKLEREIGKIREVNRENCSLLDEFSEKIRELEEDNKKLKEERDFFKEQAILWRNDYKNEYEENRKLKERIEELEERLDNKEKVNKSMREEIRKLKNSIEYRKKKADKNQEKANQIDKIMNLPGVMVDGKIDWSKVAVYYCI